MSILLQDSFHAKIFKFWKVPLHAITDFYQTFTIYCFYRENTILKISGQRAILSKVMTISNSSDVKETWSAKFLYMLLGVS